jgi:signal transduction histidine kinase
MIAENPVLPAPGLLPKAGVTIEFHQGTRYVRVLAYPITARGMQYSVQTGLALNKLMVLEENFRARLLLLAPIVVLLAAVAGHFMSRKALSPVAELARDARRINDRHLDIRLPVPRANDEIADLSRTLNQMLERIDKAFASVRTFTGNASHELRTPIALLRTEIEVALYRPRDGEEYRAILGRLHAETLRMTTLVENLLSLARADGGAEALRLTPIRVAALFRQLSELWKPAMSTAMLDFDVEIPSENLHVLADKQSIARLLSILLENAGRYTPPGGSVKLNSALDGDCIVLSVRDTGFGIAAEHKPKIFDRFYRALPAGENVPAGSGLGLALAKWIADRHQADLRVESEPGVGSCFSFSLPNTFSPVPAIELSVNSEVDAEPAVNPPLVAI